MQLYVCKVGNTLPVIIRATYPNSSYRSISLFRQAIIAANAVDDGTYPVIRDWTWLPLGTIVRIPD